MKKTLLSIGTIVSTITPVASVIACGDGDVPGHEAPYSISIQADGTTTTQANVFVDLKGFVSDSYIKEIKSRIAENIIAANKDSLKYKTMKIFMGEIAGTTLLINTTPLTDTNKNDLNVVFNLIDTPFDNFINQLKSKEFFKEFFQKEIWENQHHQIDKVDQDEIKRNLLKYLGYDNSNPDVINLKYKIISDKFIDFTITRTNVVSNPELHSTGFTDESSGYFDFVEGDLLHMKIIINDDFSIAPHKDYKLIYLSKKHPSTSFDVPSIGGSPQNFMTQTYKMAKYLLKQNGYDGQLVYKYPGRYTNTFRELEANANSASKVFAYDDNGRTFGLNYNSLDGTKSKYEFLIDFDKKTFKIIFGNTAHNQKQWIFGTDGHLVMDPSHEWSITLEGTYELNVAGDAVETITSLTKETATDGTSTIHLLNSSAKLMSKSILNGDMKFFIDK